MFPFYSSRIKYQRDLLTGLIIWLSMNNFQLSYTSPPSLLTQLTTTNTLYDQRLLFNKITAPQNTGKGCYCNQMAIWSDWMTGHSEQPSIQFAISHILTYALTDLNGHQVFHGYVIQIVVIPRIQSARFLLRGAYGRQRRTSAREIVMNNFDTAH